MFERKVAVIGGGLWGLALAAAAARAENDVVLLSRRSLDGSLPKGVRQVKDAQEAASHGRFLIVAVPPEVARSVARDLGDHLSGAHYVVHGVRGLTPEGNELATISDLIREETPVRRTGALGGPALAQDLLAGRPSVLVIGSRFPEVAEATTAALG